MAIIGKSLAVPEYGFTRYEFINKDDLTLNNEYFYSIGTFITQDTNGLLAVGVSNGDEILVKIKNTYNFRLLVCLPSSTNANTLYTNNMVVEIDGVKHTFDLTSNRNTTIIDNCLAVDIKNLSTNSHIVKIYADGNNNDTQMINVQAIDIDVKGIVGFTRTMASMFEGCANLKKDIIIPKNADVVENMFKNCTSMTHVHSNWDETYNDSGIITEDCYNGCTSITHIDDVPLSLNEYSSGLDNIPSEWGGYGFSKEYTGIYMVEILSPNYTFSFASDGLLDNGYINWGDGTTTKNEYSHTYVNAGVYIIKGKVHSTYETATDSMKLCLKEILQYPIYGNLANAFIGCTALVSANISGNKYHDIKGRAGVFLNCTNLEKVIALDTKLEKEVAHISAFQNCKKLREIIGLEDFIYNTLNLMNCFSYCSSLPNFTLSEDGLKNCTSLYQAFSDCTSLTESPIKTFVSNSNSLSIGRMFVGCTNLTDISGVTFGKNITNADNWYPPNLTTANNVTIKNRVVSFQGNTTLQYCNNLRSYYAKSFNGCTALVELKNLLIKSEDGTVISNDGMNAYRGCNKLKIIKFDPNCKIKYTSCDFIFLDNPLLEEVDFGGGVTLEPKDSGEHVFGATPAIKTIKNMKVGGTSTKARFSGYSINDYGLDFPNLEYLDCTIMTQVASKFFKGSGIKDVSNVKFDTSIEDLSESFMNNRLLLRDVEVQSHIRNCSSMFRNCTVLTHVRSNWDNRYTGGITATDCYSGCTAITHIDDKSVIAYKGDNSLDYIPIEWGGNGLTDDGTVSIYEVTIPSDNFTLRLFPWNYGFSRRQGRDVNEWTGISLDNHINWGDGESYTNNSIDGAGYFPTHTYAKAGVYYIKGHIGRFGAGLGLTETPYNFENDAKSRITRILKSAYRAYHVGVDAYRTVNLANYFKGLSVLKSVSNLKITNEITNLEGLFQDCTSLVSVDLSDCDMSNVVNMGSMFYNCKSFTEAPIKNFPNSVTNISNIFSGCSSLKQDIEIPSHITNCSGMFQSCTSMTHVRSNWENEYNGGIISTDCYSGCTAITHIDNKNVIAYNGDVALDYIPSEWGGNGLIDDGTISIYEVTIPSDNYNLQLFSYEYGFSRRGLIGGDWHSVPPDNHINWGDGESFKGEGSKITDFPWHTYAKAGIYYIKGHFGNFGSEISPTATCYGNTPSLKACLTRILKHAYRAYNVIKGVYSEPMNLGGFGAFSGLYNLKSVSGLKISKEHVNLQKTFSDCTRLVSVDFSDCDTSGVTTMFGMFQGCSSLTSLDLSGFNVSKVTDMSEMFNGCKKWTDFSFMKSWDLSSVTSFNTVFADSGISEFSGCVANNITGYINGNFQRCSNVTKVSYEGINLMNVTGNFYVGFTSCSSLKEVSFKNTNLQFTSTLFMFERCDLLETIDFTSCHFNYNSHSDSYNFGLTNSVKNIIFSENSFEGCPTVIINSTSLTVDSLLSLFNALVTISDSRTLKIGSANLAKLSSEQIKIATDKGWTVV